MFSFLKKLCGGKKKKVQENTEKNAEETEEINEEETIENETIEEDVFEEELDIFEEVAQDLEIEPELLKAFVTVETNGSNKLNDRVIIRWEPHIFKKKTNVTVKVHGKRGHITQECQDNEWDALNRATLVQDGEFETEAFESASWGIGQIMGFNYSKLGFDSVNEMIDYISDSEENGIRSIGKFIKSHAKLLQACKDKDFRNIAYYYNGKYYYRNKYDEKLEHEYNNLKITI